VRADKRFSEQCAAELRAEIAGAGGNEVFALGWLDGGGLVARIEIAARGNGGAVLALRSFRERGGPPASPEEGPEAGPDVLIHNHPSGFLTPSDNDLVIAARAAEEGVGSFIVDNAVGEAYVVAEPTRRRERKALEADRVIAALEEGGAIARRLPSYEKRESQLELMRLVIRAFNEDALAAAEAGTGVGKSFAYLLPALSYALANDERIVISTATITLQQQLFEKDIPLVQSALPAGKKIKAVLMKGRGNYLCRRRLADTLREPALLDEGENRDLAAIAAWAESSPTGSRSDLAFLPAEALWGRVCSEADLCMGMRCPERERCFVLSLRREAASARIIVVNHHLLFADLAARHEGAGYEHTVVLPPYRRVIIDEAHTVEGAATSFFSRNFSRPGIYRQLGRLYRRRRGLPGGLLPRLAAFSGGAEGDLDPLAEAVGKIRDTADLLDQAGLELTGEEGVFRLTPGRDEPVRLALAPHLAALRRQTGALGALVAGILEGIGEGPAEDPVVWEVKSILRRLDTLGSAAGDFIEYKERPHEVMWIERHPGTSGPWASFTITPLEVAPSLREALFEPNKTVVCVSATLTVAGSFGFWQGRSGFGLSGGASGGEASHDDAPLRKKFTGCFPSPFPYASSVLLAVPAGAPLPEEAGYRAFVDQAVTRLAESAGGSALILFTSYEALRSAYQCARPVLEAAGIRCLKQGDDDRHRLLKSFLEDTGSVLFATDSFWEGVDAPGDTLRLVILCRLPFKSPSDPVFEARREALERQGGSPFMDLSLPEAVMKFKQGFGRLMRRSSDHGVVAVLDGRLLRKRYGDFFLRSLPETRTSFTAFDSLLRETENFLYSD
jgi:ATP-dependent DNA helicase DinG